MLSKRNGKIELLRFFFCISVLLFHAGRDVLGSNRVISENLTFFTRGFIGVEFFFLLSGFLAAKTASKFRKGNNTIGSETFNFILKKIKTILPYHIFAVIFAVILLYRYSDNFILEFANRCPDIFFLQRTGISNYSLVSVEWYICSMLLALAVVYPLLLKNFDLTTLVLSPVVSSLTIGYLVKTYGAMPGSSIYGKYTYACNIRGMALVLLGCFCYAVCEKIKSVDISGIKKVLLIISENVCWIIALYYPVSDINRRYEAYVVYFMALGMTLTFSRSFHSKLYDNKFVYFLGKLSLPIYLCQNIAREIVKNDLTFLSAPIRIILILVLAIAVGLLAEFICSKIKNICSRGNRSNKELINKI